MIISDNHPFLNSSQEIDELSKPLKQLDITYFQYAKHTADGGRIWLTNMPKVITTYYEKNFHLSGNTESHPDKYKPAILLWSTLPKQYLYDHCAELGIYDGMFIVSPSKDGSCEFYAYGTNKRDKTIINTYLSHLDMIKKHNLYFKESADKLIKSANDCKLYTPFHNDSIDFIDKIYKSDVAKLLSTSSPSNKIKLSPRQLECAMHLLDGKTNKQISIHTGLSIRTIEYYIDIIRNKLGCANKVELVLELYKLINNGLNE